MRGDKLEEAVRIRDLLALNSEELRSVARALNGEYILPEAGGDLLRDGAGGACSDKVGGEVVVVVVVCEGWGIGCSWRMGSHGYSDIIGNSDACCYP